VKIFIVKFRLRSHH